MLQILILKEKNMYSKFSESSLFNGIKPGEIGEILKITHHQIKVFDAESIIAYSGDKCKSLYIIIEGSVRGEVVDYSGKTIKIEDINAPDTFAEAFLFASRNMLLVNIIANTKTKLLIIHKEDLLRLFQSNKKILENFLTITSDRFVTVTKKLKFLSLKTIKGKLAQYFLQLAKENNSNIIILKQSQHELAEYFGITRPSLARSVRDLNNEGYIRARGKKIEIIDKEKLLHQIRM